MAALEDIAAERQRQITAEGWTTEHDDAHSNGETPDVTPTRAGGENKKGRFPSRRK